LLGVGRVLVVVEVLPVELPVVLAGTGSLAFGFSVFAAGLFFGMSRPVGICAEQTRPASGDSQNKPITHKAKAL